MHTGTASLGDISFNSNQTFCHGDKISSNDYFLSEHMTLKTFNITWKLYRIFITFRKEKYQCSYSIRLTTSPFIPMRQITVPISWISHNWRNKFPTTSDVFVCFLKVKTSFGNAPLSKNEMEARITNHVKEYVLTNTWSYKFCWETAY